MIGSTLQGFEADFIAWIASFGFPATELMKLVLAAFLGGLAGIEREIRGRQAGFRTFTLVSTGSCLVMLVSIHVVTVPVMSGVIVPGNGVNINADPARIAYGVMTGIGFLGAGTIVHSKGTVRGLTTAAGIWCVAAIGLCVGVGMYTVALGTTILVVLILWVLNYVERIVPQPRLRQFVVQLPWSPTSTQNLVHLIESLGMDVIEANLERTEDRQHARIETKVSYRHIEDLRKLEKNFHEGAIGIELLGSKEI